MNAVTGWFSTMSQRLSARGAARRDEASPSSPDDLLVAAGRGDIGAFGLFYDHVGGRVFGLVRAVLRDPAATEVLVHDIFLELWHTAGRFSPDQDAVRWVTTLAHRRAVEFVRSTRSDPCHGAPDPGTRRLSTPAGLAGTPLMREECGAISKGLALMTEPQREAVLLAYFEGRTYREVGESLDSTATAVSAEIRDGLMRLRGVLC